MLEKLRNILSGGKTYLVCVGAIIAALIAYANGTMDIGQMIQAIWTAIAGITLRAGIAKSAPKE